MTDKQPQQGGTLVPYEAELPAGEVDTYFNGCRVGATYTEGQVRSILGAAYEHYAAQVAAMAQPQGDAAMPVAAHKVIGPRGDLIGIFENATIAAMMVSKNSAEVGPTSSRRLVDEADAQAAIAARDAQIAELEGVIKSAEEGGDLLQKDVEARDAEIERVSSRLETLVRALRERHHGCMPKGVQDAYDAAAAITIYKDAKGWIMDEFTDGHQLEAMKLALAGRQPAPEAAQPSTFDIATPQFHDPHGLNWSGAETAQPTDTEAQVQEVVGVVCAACAASSDYGIAAALQMPDVGSKQAAESAALAAVESAIRRLVGGK
jgi:hypothetical protein